MSWHPCAALLERGDPDRFAALRAAGPASRPALAVLWAFNLELARAPWAATEPMIAEMRLQWWADVVAEPAPRAHEVAGPLQALIAARGLPVAQLQGMAEARRWDVWRDPFADRAAFDAYLGQTAGALADLSVMALGGAGGQAARDYGWAAGLAAFLRAVPGLEARGRVPLVDGRGSAVRALAEEGLARLAAARAARASIAPQARDALLPGWQTAGLLAQAARDPAAVAEGRLALSEFRRRGGLVWQALSGRW
jgi:phytoene/squalene synthetase